MDAASRYELLEKLGTGSFATVFRARDNELNREVAVRQIHSQYLNDPRFLDRYWAEAAQAISEGGGRARADALIGVSRFVVVADTDEQALAIAERAWPRFYDNFYKLWRRHGTEPARLKLATDFAGMVAAGQGVAGSPQTVIDALGRQARDGRLNYLVGQFMFGDLPHDAALRSVGLFAGEVMPALRLASREWL